MAARKNSKPQLAGVDDYPERSLEDALMPEGEAAAREDIQPDQIADYHETHPTLSNDSDIDMDVIEELHQDELPIGDDLPPTDD